MKLIRLPSGPLACVFPVEGDLESESQPGKESGVYRAFSGSVEADGSSESQAIEALDAEVRRLSVPPAPEIEEFEHSRAAANDSPSREGAPAGPSVRYARVSEFDTLPAPAPASSSRRGAKR